MEDERLLCEVVNKLKAHHSKKGEGRPGVSQNPLQNFVCAPRWDRAGRRSTRPGVNNPLTAYGPAKGPHSLRP